MAVYISSRSIGVTVSLWPRLVASILLASIVGCSGGGPQTPTAPTPPVSSTPPAQSPPAPAPAAANLIMWGGIEYLSCIEGLCDFRGLLRNMGDVCAVNIGGETRVMSAQGQEVARSARWTLPASAIVRPGEAVNYIGRLPQVALNHLDGHYNTSFTFDSRPC